MNNLLIQEFIRIRKERGLSLHQVSQIIGVSEKQLIMYENNELPMSFEFMMKVLQFAGGDILSSLANVFTQGNFGCKIPLVSEEDVINDEDKSVEFYYELPDIEDYAKDGMFAIEYDGDDIPEYGILSGCKMIFVNCKSVDRDGVYAIISRDKLRYKKAEIISDTGEIRLTPLDGARRLPKRFKKVSARGRMICAVNTYK